MPSQSVAALPAGLFLVSLREGLFSGAGEAPAAGENAPATTVLVWSPEF